jgi:hypothetical protein
MASPRGANSAAVAALLDGKRQEWLTQAIQPHAAARTVKAV